MHFWLVATCVLMCGILQYIVRAHILRAHHEVQYGVDVGGTMDT